MDSRSPDVTQVGFPLQLDRRGRLYEPDYDDHVMQMIELVLFTSPGERVNRPEFGAGLIELIFTGNDQPEAAAAEYLVQTSLQRWLSDVIDLRTVQVTARDSTLEIQVVYSLRLDGREQVAVFETPVW
ncbi:MAG: GPW/gp25 family protein [Holophagales bacterium]|nr:GPW/gp25 family protein [Holophagales bacterium]